MLAQHTRGTYGYFDPITPGEVTEAVSMAAVMIDHARLWPGGGFHRPVSME